LLRGGGGGWVGNMNQSRGRRGGIGGKGLRWRSGKGWGGMEEGEEGKKWWSRRSRSIYLF